MSDEPKVEPAETAEIAVNANGNEENDLKYDFKVDEQVEPSVVSQSEISHPTVDSSPVPNKISSGTPPKSQYVRLRGLPFNATEKDIQEFFNGLTVKRTKFVCTTGRPNGEAYVEFENKDDAGKAMENDRKEMSNRYIEIFTVDETEAEFEFRPDPEGNGEENYVVRLRGIPWSCKDEDIHKFFEGLEPPPAEIVIGGTGGPKSRPSGEAFVRFSTQEAAEKAMEYNNRHMGTRYVEVFMSSMVEFNRAKGGGGSAGNYERSGIRPLMSVDSGYSQGRGGGANNYGGGYGGYDEYRAPYGGQQDYGYGSYDQGYAGDYGRGIDEPLRVYMRGLPYDAEQYAIEGFFAPLRCHSIKLGVNESGRPSGDAIAEFDSVGDLQAALQRNNQRMGRRYVELFDTRGAPGPMRRLLWKETSGPNAHAAPAPDPILNGGKRAPAASASHETGYRAGPQAMPPSYREPRDPYGPRAPKGLYERESRDAHSYGAPTRAPAPAHGRAPDPWGSYGASGAYDQSYNGYEGYVAYNASYPSSGYGAPNGDSYTTPAAANSYDRQRESRDTQSAWAQHQQSGGYGGWGPAPGDRRTGY
uniref:RRM domain-containing protein n=1 Tax=Caenorhabditis tropicalis TaxID=1561998 RepID=A0A1I7SYP1_9PELO